MNNIDSILVTGGTGFIGRNLINAAVNLGIKKIRATYNSTMPPKIDSVDWVKVDLSKEFNEDIFLGVDVAYLCAAVSSGAKDILERPEIFVTGNTLINQNSILAAVNKRVKNIVFPSCSIMYSSSNEIQNENDVELTKIYEKYLGGAHMKLYIEGLCKFYSLNSKTKFLVIRHTNTYGPYDKFDSQKAHVLAASILKTENSPKQVVIWGNGEEARDFIYIDDLTDLMLSTPSIQEDGYELLCAGSETKTTITDLIRKICKIRGIEPEIIYDLEKPTLPVNIILSNQYARDKYGWQPKLTLEDGIAKTIIWRESNKRDGSLAKK